MSKRRSDKGYSLVEMIIVLAIIALVATMALISVSVIHSAKAKDAASTVDAELATLITRSKNMNSDEEGWDYAARIYKDGSIFYYQKGYYNPETNAYKWSDRVSLTSYVDVRYAANKAVPDGDASEQKVEEMNSGNGLYIRFSKNGTCVEGAGDIRFCKRNGNVVANVYIRKNGSHQLR